MLGRSVSRPVQHEGACVCELAFLKLVFELGVEEVMNANSQELPQTSRRLWVATFAGMFLSISWIEIYPDYPLWLAFVLIPMMVAQAVFFSFDWEIVFHFLRLVAAFVILVGASWVMHCGLIFIGRHFRVRSKQT